jgi:hypothetical protein
VENRQLFERTMIVVVSNYEKLPKCFYEDILHHAPYNPEDLRFPSNLRVFTNMSNLEVAALTSGILSMTSSSKVLFVDN